MKKFAFAAMALVGATSTASGAISASEASRLAAAASVVQALRPTIPDEYWARARCAAVVPELKKAAFIIGGEYGKGVMSCRTEEAWGAPMFMQLAKGSWGFQAGAEQVDVVLLVMNEAGVQKLLMNKVTLGADASVAAGPIGRQGSVGTDAQLQAEILSYSRAQGLFAGIDLSGGVLRRFEQSRLRGRRHTCGDSCAAGDFRASRGRRVSPCPCRNRREDRGFVVVRRRPIGIEQPDRHIVADDPALDHDANYRR